MTIESAGATGGADDLDLFEAEATGQPVTKVEPNAIPDKYKGKTAEELITMHMNAERLLARQGGEVGQLRRMADQILELKRPETRTTEERKPVTVDALLSDPEAAIRDAVANSDVVKRAERAEARVDALETSITKERFAQKHTSYSRDLEDPEFRAWVNKQPLRVALAAEAAKDNFVAATNLWDMWDEFKELSGAAAGGNAQSTTTSTAKKIPSTVRQAPADASAGKPRNWDRAKLMELRMKVQQGDPAALARWSDKGFQERMHKAYEEKRVV